MNLSESFNLALKDYTLLLNKGYPQKSILQLVATRYSLNQFERSMLYRGVTSEEKAQKRRQRFTRMPSVKGETLHIDLFNALFTIAAYLRGYPVYIANDGVLRDASENHGCEDWIEHLQKGLALMMQFLDKAAPGSAYFYIDNPMQHCRQAIESIHMHCQEAGLDHEIILHDSPDHILEKATGGILASSDSTIIDRSGLPVFDLPRAVLTLHFEPTFHTIEALLE
jgi:hypothetical protein